MKHFYTFLLSIFLGGFLFAQTTILTGLNLPHDILLDGTDLYIAEWNIERVVKIDVSADTPTITAVVTALAGPMNYCLSATTSTSQTRTQGPL